MKLLIIIILMNISFFVKAQTTKKEAKLKVTYYESGKLKSKGNVVNNKKEGEWIYYHENGNIALKKNFVNGFEKGEWLYYNEDGNISLKVDDISKINETANLYLYKNGKIISTKKAVKDDIIIKQKF